MVETSEVEGPMAIKTNEVLAVLALVVCLVASPAVSQTAPAARTAAPPGAKVFFEGLKDGATVPSRLTVKFGAANVALAPAGEVKPNAGHHHLLVDTELKQFDQPIPSDPNHLHFGKAQTEGEVILGPGTHTLQLVLGDHNHVPHNPPIMSEVIRVTVDPASIERARTASAPSASVGFVNVKDGDTIPLTSVVRFSVTGMELQPAGTAKPNSGHHHLIIDADEPTMDREIPSDPNHVHFGKGQTEAEITLPPGRHSLQLVLGDQDHVPHDPPVKSARIFVNVANVQGDRATQPRGSSLTPAPPDAAVYFVYPRNGEIIYPNSTIRFGLRNMGVAPAGIRKEGTGHHHLIIDAPTPALDKPIPSDPNHLHFGNGQTEKRIQFKPGQHTLQLILADDQHIPFDPPVMSERITVTVGIPPRPTNRKAKRPVRRNASIN
jgi:hypothetical protein